MLTFSKKSKKSKHGKKNWRKNIDVSDIEQTQQKINQQQIKNQKISDLKNTDLFELDDNLDNANIKPKKFLGKKTKKPKKVSKMEQRQIKRIIESSKTKAVLNNLDKDKNQNENKIYDLWENNDKNNINKNNNTSLKLKYPKVPIPHPGQSYNPQKKDLNTLLTTVVEKNKYLIPSPEPSISSENSEKNDWDDEASEEITKPVANNEPVSDLNRLTMKKFEREQKKLEEEKAKKELEEKKKEKIKNYEIKKGIIDDKELLEDFQVNKEPIPLRKMREEINPLSERWENIMKRNMIGEYSNKIRKTGNRKLKKIKFMDIDGPIDYDENLNNFHIIE